MANQPPYPHPSDPGAAPNHGSATRMPWRMYAFWAIVIALALLMVVLHLTGVIKPGTH